MKIAVIGGGASGMMCAIAAAEQGADVTLLEKNEKTGKKLYISGKGRCNLTNDCAPAEFLQNVVVNGKFLQSTVHKFSPADTLEFCRAEGLPVKTERGNRVFPQSDKSSDVIKAFNRAMERRGVKVRLNCAVTDAESVEGGFALKTSQGEEFFDKIVVACGGYSYRATGCDGFGYRLAQKFGHTVTPLRPALCRLLCRGAEKLEGLSLKNVEVSFCDGRGRRVASEFGEMLFTADGVSGPAVLSLSSQINKADVRGGKIILDLKPALDVATLDARVLRDFSERQNRNLENALDALLPARLISAVVEQSGVDGTKKVNQITAAERSALVQTLKNLCFPFVALDDINFGIVTSGGVKVSEINPSTMESKLVRGLYFCGEVLDVDAYTGGFNIQIALSTGHLAGVSAANS